MIPIWLSRAAKGEDLVVYGGEQVIDFVWVDLIVEALLRASQADVVAQPINIGSGKGISILELARRILELSGSASKLDHRPARSVEVVKYTAKVDLMRARLGLEPPDDPLFALPKLAALMPDEGSAN